MSWPCNSTPDESRSMESCRMHVVCEHRARPWSIGSHRTKSWAYYKAELWQETAQPSSHVQDSEPGKDPGPGTQTQAALLEEQLKTQLPSARFTGHLRPQPIHVWKGWGLQWSDQRTLRTMYFRKKLYKYWRHAPWKSWKEGNRLLKQRSGGTKVRNENKHSTEQALPALAATSDFYLHQWHCAPRNVWCKCQQNLTEVLRTNFTKVVVVRTTATLKWNWWPHKGRRPWNVSFHSWQQLASNTDA